MLHPQARALLDLMIERGVPPTHTLSVADARRFYLERRHTTQPVAPAIDEVRDLQAPGPLGDIPLRLYRHGAADGLRPALVFFHGGGWVIGDLDTHDTLCRQLAIASGCAVVSVDYRMGPEHPFPAATDDACAATRWLAAQAGSLGLDATRLAVGGDSAGGTLATVTALAARDQGWPLALQVLFYPGCAGHQSTPSHHTFSTGFLLEEAHISYFFNQYLNHPQERDDWRFAPLDGVDETGSPRDLEGVAPAWIGLAECDPLVDEGVMYADRLRMHAVPVELEIYAGVVHGFIQFGRAIPQALSAHNDAARALRHAFGG